MKGEHAMKRLFITCLIMLPMVVHAQNWMFESFEAPWTNNGTTPPGWTKTNVIGSADWDQRSYPLAGQISPGRFPYSGRAVAHFSSSAAAGTTTRLESPALTFSATTSAFLKIYYFNRDGSDSLRVRVSTDGGSSWTTIATYAPHGGTDTTWRLSRVSLNAFAGRPNVRIALEAVADGGTSDIWVDHLLVSDRNVTIQQIQQVPDDWLRLADSLQRSQPLRWTLQASPYFGDTVTVTALCVVPAKVITFTASGFTMLLYDTASRGSWRGLFVRVSGDTNQAIADGFLNVQRGNIIRMVGRVDEFPTGPSSDAMNSLTQFVPILGNPIPLLGVGTVPPAIETTADSFYVGVFPGGTVRYSSGEKYEAMMVWMRGLLIPNYINATNGTFNMVQAGNTVGEYDISKWYTLRAHRDPTSTYVLPPLQARVDSIRGMITTASGGENPRGYRIAPMFQDPPEGPDLFIGVSLPAVAQSKRQPLRVTSDTLAAISVRVWQQAGGFSIGTVTMYYSVNNGPFTAVPMTYTVADSTARAAIPQQPLNAFVRYYFVACDVQNNCSVLANAGFAGGDDTTSGFYFYYVHDRNTPLTIRDVQYSPFRHGMSSFYLPPTATNPPVTISGIITADTSDLLLINRSTFGTAVWYLQSTNNPWNGIWIRPPDLALPNYLYLRRGDSVTVTGRIFESNQGFGAGTTTRMLIDTTYPVIVHGSGNPIPNPVVKTTGTFGPTAANGDSAAEPYEGMLVKFLNVTVTDLRPYFADTVYIYAISDGTGDVWVHRDGTNRYTSFEPDSTDPSWRVLRVGDRFHSITGLIFFSANRYKFCPRSNADFEPVTGVVVQPGVVPAAYRLEQNYPNPFNPRTTIEYDLPHASVVSLKVYNILGQEVATLVNGQQSAGRYTVHFDASSLASGVYFYRLSVSPSSTRDPVATDRDGRVGFFTSTKKMLLVR